MAEGIPWDPSSVEELESLLLFVIARFVPSVRTSIKMNAMIMSGNGLKFKSLLSKKSVRIIVY